jgi:ABC-type transport system involved in multi-copper enzyme maturation permease subunit
MSVAARTTRLPRTPGRTLGGVIGWFANPLATKELLARMRGPRTFVVATLELLPLIGLAIGLYAIMGSSRSGLTAGAPAGKLFFGVVTTLELGLICLFAPALTADLISGERERRTLDLLLVTPLSRLQIVIGKLIAALGALLLLIVLALPVQAVAVLLGGVDIEDLLVGLAILVLTAVTYGCVGLYWSGRLRTTRGAVLMAYATMLVGVGGVPLVLFLGALSSGVLASGVGDRLWPVIWLVNGPSSSTLHSVFGRPEAQGALQSGWLPTEAIVAQVIVATNPLLAGIASAAGLVQGRPLVGMEQVAQTDVLYIAPWLLFAAVHLLAIVLLVWLTSRALRRDLR